MKRQQIVRAIPHRPRAKAKIVRRYFKCPIERCTRVEVDQTFYVENKAWGEGG
jgi:hypothetical protein